MVDEEIRRLVDEGHQKAQKVLEKHRDDLDRLALGLLEYETLTGDEIQKVIAGDKLDRGDDEGGPDAPDAKPTVASVPKSRRRRGVEDGIKGASPEPQEG